MDQVKNDQQKIKRSTEGGKHDNLEESDYSSEDTIQLQQNDIDTFMMKIRSQINKRDRDLIMTAICRVNSLYKSSTYNESSNVLIHYDEDKILIRGKPIIDEHLKKVIKEEGQRLYEQVSQMRYEKIKYIASQLSDEPITVKVKDSTGKIQYCQIPKEQTFQKEQLLSTNQELQKQIETMKEWNDMMNQQVQVMSAENEMIKQELKDTKAELEKRHQIECSDTDSQFSEQYVRKGEQQIGIIDIKVQHVFDMPEEPDVKNLISQYEDIQNQKKIIMLKENKVISDVVQKYKDQMVVYLSKIEQLESMKNKIE